MKSSGAKTSVKRRICKWKLFGEVKINLPRKRMDESNAKWSVYMLISAKKTVKERARLVSRKLDFSKQAL